MRSCLSAAVVLVLFSLLSCRQAPADADTIAERLAARALEDFAGIDDFIVYGRSEFAAAGNEGVAVYFRRADSLSFDAAARDGGGDGPPIVPPYMLPNAVQLAERLVDNAALVGTERLGEHEVYVVDARDPNALLDIPPGTEGPGSVRLYIDAETFRLREIRLTAQASDSVETPLVERRRYTSFQTVDGLTIPFTAITTLENLPVSDEERVVRGGAIPLKKQQAESLPPAEREHALRQIRREERYILSGTLEESFRVARVVVNTGVPADVFAPPLVLPDSQVVEDDSLTAE